MVWTGPRASIIERYSTLLDDLMEYPDDAVVNFVSQEKLRLANEINTARHYDTLVERERDERFEY
jgi:hypothetical protein